MRHISKFDICDISTPKLKINIFMFGIKPNAIWKFFSEFIKSYKKAYVAIKYKVLNLNLLENRGRTIPN